MDDIFSERRKSVLYNSSYEFQQEVDREEKIEREISALKLQVELTKRVQDLETTIQKQREIDRQERAKEREADYIQRQQERHSDRWFSAKTLIIAVVLGGLFVKLLEFIFK
ncbi:MAG: hypothetical protein JSU01_23005 [Bacteroidetes bacterium]|nr:hypothetical protein [Bacteroidota bacterium]